MTWPFFGCWKQSGTKIQESPLKGFYQVFGALNASLFVDDSTFRRRRRPSVEKIRKNTFGDLFHGSGAMDKQKDFMEERCRGRENLFLLDPFFGFKGDTLCGELFGGILTHFLFLCLWPFLAFRVSKAVIKF